MAEYLSPGVYLEEIDVGIRPIEGVSTSTAGMVGNTERGPKNFPRLVTSFADFERIFGRYLDSGVYGRAAQLPHAVEGFFRNGGRRLFVTRIVADQPAPNEATNAVSTLFDMGRTTGFGDTTLLKHARETDSLILVEAVAGLANGETIRLDDGRNTEYGALAAAGAVIASNTRVLALRIPLYFGHLPGDPVGIFNMPAAAAAVFDSTLNGPHAAGDGVLALNDVVNANVVAGSILEVGIGASLETVQVLDPAAGPSLQAPLTNAHADGEPVALIADPTDFASTLAVDHAAGTQELVASGNSTRRHRSSEGEWLPGTRLARQAPPRAGGEGDTRTPGSTQRHPRSGPAAGTGQG